VQLIRLLSITVIAFSAHSRNFLSSFDVTEGSALRIDSSKLSSYSESLSVALPIDFLRSNLILCSARIREIHL